jgi:3-dehydroquinate synthase
MRSFLENHHLSTSPEPGRELLELGRRETYSTLGVVLDSQVPTWDFERTLFPAADFIHMVEGGENCKTLDTLCRFVDACRDHVDKRSLIIVIGGGAVLDAMGLGCGLLYRGIRYLSAPSSLIGIADAAYGGKTAINLQGKNQIGMYHHPVAVYVYPQFLDSLPDEHRRSGMVEIAKLAVFYSDIRRALASPLEDAPSLAQVAILAATRKLELLEKDPYEEREASVLLYGHAFGNAFETFAYERDGKHVPHGFAVALGMSFSAWLGEKHENFAGRYDEINALLSTWVNLSDLASLLTPSSGTDFVNRLFRDKYSLGTVVRLPALTRDGGYTAVGLSEIEESYEKWRVSLAPALRASNKNDVIREPRSGDYPLYIAGRPIDETVVPLCFASADNAHLVTTDGRRILDWSASLNVPFGHGCRVDTIGMPINSGNYATEARNVLVGQLHSIFPFLSGFQFRSSGTESVEAAIRYVQTALGPRTRMITIDHCYHGLTLGARSLMGQSIGSLTRSELPFESLNDSDLLRTLLLKQLKDGPIAVWLEGVQGATLRQLPSSALAIMEELREEHPGRVAIVADDMLASIRCGDWSSISSVQPDVLIAGKSWANGYPFSFFGVKQWLRMEAGDILGTTSYGGNPIACANASYTIQRIQAEHVFQHIGACERSQGPRLASLAHDRVSISRTEWHGLLFGLELDNTQLARETASRAAAGGLLVSQLGPVIRCSPPLNTSHDLLQSGMLILTGAIA